MIYTNKAAVGRLAHRLAAGYYAFLVGQHVAVSPLSVGLLPPPEQLGHNPTGEIQRNDGTANTLDVRRYLDLLGEDPRLQLDVLLSWATGALLTRGDALSAHNYFDRAPVLKLVYHLRNAVAHGNRFAISRIGQKRLTCYPAHNRDAIMRSPAGTVSDVIPNTTGAVLLKFMGAADVIYLF